MNRVSFYDRSVKEVLAVCESPLEASMVEAFLDDGWVATPHGCDLVATWARGFEWLDGHHAPFLVTARGRFALLVQQPVRVNTLPHHRDGAHLCLRPDFLVLRPMAPPVAVEVDGHDFHETREQAAKDRSRDRALSAVRWTVVRFTGSEVHASAAKCARELGAILGWKYAAPPGDAPLPDDTRPFEEQLANLAAVEARARARLARGR